MSGAWWIKNHPDQRRHPDQGRQGEQRHVGDQGIGTAVLTLVASKQASLRSWFAIATLNAALPFVGRSEGLER